MTEEEYKKNIEIRDKVISDLKNGYDFNTKLSRISLVVAAIAVVISIVRLILTK